MRTDRSSARRIAGGFEGNILPLSPNLRRIVVIGGHADVGVLAGGGSSLVYPRGGNAAPGIGPTAWPGPVMYYPSSPIATIKRIAPGATVEFNDGADPAAAARLADGADVVIAFATQWAGESFDVPLSLGDQDRLIFAVAAANRRTVVVLETGGPVLTPWRNRALGILEAWYPGTEGGAAIANLLFGRAEPSGRLPVTFPAEPKQLPDTDPPHTGDVRYAEGAAVGYKWYDKNDLQPAFAFGSGKGYTAFSYDGLTATASEAGISASFQLKNTGARTGATVGQIYVAPIAGGWEAPLRLGAFAKASLAPGEARTMTVTIDPRLPATWKPQR